MEATMNCACTRDGKGNIEPCVAHAKWRDGATIAGQLSGSDLEEAKAALLRLIELAGEMQAGCLKVARHQSGGVTDETVRTSMALQDVALQFAFTMANVPTCENA
jgi:hypothetical protein